MRLIGRRSFIVSAAATGVAAIAGAACLINTREDRILQLHAVDTGERVTAAYWSNGRYLEDGLAAIQYVLRDFKTDLVGSFDLGLLENLHSLVHALNGPTEIEVVRGYIGADAKMPIVAGSPDSYHAAGRALDVRIPGVSLEHLAMELVRLFDGGIGLYTREDFAHVDVGPRRVWRVES